MDTHFYNRTARDLLSVHSIQPVAAVTTTGDITTLTGNFIATTGTLELGGVLNDNTENKLLVIDAATNLIEYRDVSSLPNRFDRELNTFNDVTFESVKIRDVGDTSYMDITTDNSSTNLVSKSDFTGAKEVVISHSTTGLTTFKLENSNITAGSQAQLNIDSTDDSYISFRDDGVSNKFHIGLNEGASEFRITRGSSGMDSTVALSVDLSENVLLNTMSVFSMPEDIISREKLMVWDSTSKTVLWKDMANLPLITDFPIITIDGGTLTMDTLFDDYANFTLDSADATRSKFFTFTGDTSGVLLQTLINNNIGAAAHAGISIQTDVSGTNAGGNELIIYETLANSSWTNGRQKSTDTFRWDYNAATSSYLVGSADTKMFLDTSGNLDIDGSLSLKSGNTIISSINDSETGFLQTPAITTGSKRFIFNSDTTNDVTAFIQNQNAGAAAHSAVLLQTDRLACTGGGGNQVILYDTCSIGGWEAGRQRTTNTFRWNYGLPSYLTDDANTRMVLGNSGTLQLKKSGDNGVTFEPINDSYTILRQVPAVTTGNKQFQFRSNTSNDVMCVDVFNDSAAATAHTATCTYSQATGGNNMHKFIKQGTGNWSMGYQSGTNDFRLNWDTVGNDNLTNDANTKLFLDTAGNLDIDGTLSLNSSNVVITGVSDSFTSIKQTPAITTGEKFVNYESESSGGVQIEVNNLSNVATANSGFRARIATGSSGNMYTSYFNNGTGQWIEGYQGGTNDHRWNWDTVGSDVLNTDANTRMILDTSGNLDINGTLTSSPADTILDSYVGTISDTGVLNKAIRTAFSATNDQTLSTTIVSAIGAYYTMNSGGWGTAYNQFTGDWTSVAGANVTYSGTQDGIVTISGNMVFTASNNDIVELAIFQNAGRRVGSRTVVVNGNSSNLSVQVNIALVVGDVITLKVANHSTTTDIITRSGWMNIVSV
mgnify:CR=1 FL=1